MNLKIPKNATEYQKGVVSLIIVAILLTVGYFGYTHYQPAYVYTVLVDGQEVGIIRQHEQLEQIVSHLTEQEKKKTGYEVVIAQEVTTERKFELNPQLHLPNLQYRISQLATFESAGTLVLVEGKPAVVVENQEIANQIIEDIRNYYTEQAKGKTVETKVLTDLSFKSVAVRPEEIYDYESAKSLLLRGTTRYETYQVSRGDSLSAIARRANISVEELKTANGLNSDSIQIGQELKLTSAEPLLAVEVVKEDSVFESIPFTTEWKNTSSLFTWQTRVVTPGKNGQREATYRVTLVNGKEVAREQISNNVISEPVTRIAERGTATMPGRGVGQFRWPLQAGVGRITSPFGNRINPVTGRAQFHTGIDIASSAGTPIYAAASGRVAVVRRDEHGYGHLVIIDHGNGYASYYAHMQRGSITVSEGQSVSAGQRIGGMGATGQTTGVHLHFEIRTGYKGNVSGNAVNPLNFFAP